MKLPILCMSCSQHILNLDTTLLAWPLRFEMFEFTAPNWVWPAPGPMNTDIFCPVCMGFPMHWSADTGEVGAWLNVLDGNGRPKMVSVEQLLSGRPPVVKEGNEVYELGMMPGKIVPASCPLCGAKPGRGGKILMHKKGCPTKGTVAKAVMPPPQAIGDYERRSIINSHLVKAPSPENPEEQGYQQPSSLLDAFNKKQLNNVVAQVTGKKPTAETEPISKEDIAELERDRLHRERPAAHLRAIQN